MIWQRDADPVTERPFLRPAAIRSKYVEYELIMNKRTCNIQKKRATAWGRGNALTNPSIHNIIIMGVRIDQI
jgi:hypothetical protein